MKAYKRNRANSKQYNFKQKGCICENWEGLLDEKWNILGYPQYIGWGWWPVTPAFNIVHKSKTY